MSRTKIFLTGRDFVNWATDDDFNLTKSALERFAEVVTDVQACDVIHSVNWHSLLGLDSALLREKVVVSHIPHDVRNMLGQPEYLKVAPYVDRWAVPSKKAERYAGQLGLNPALVPYGIDAKTFYPIDDQASLREKYGLPTDRYLIGSFQRDTEGRDLKTPKYVKGPDVFLTIVKRIYENNNNVHVVLAGPRRFWLRDRLKAAGIPYTFVGQANGGRDDIKQNTLDQSTINELYNALDLYVVASRLEGGPKAVLECAATRTKIISTDVGQAADVLHAKQIYRDVFAASDLALADIGYGELDQYCGGNFERAKQHSIERVAARWGELYSAGLGKTPPPSCFKPLYKLPKRNPWHRLLNGLFRKRLTIYFKFHRGPWGGGNQFLKALTDALRRRGWWVGNALDFSPRVFLFNSFHAQFGDSIPAGSASTLMVHRIDGPTFLIRGKDFEVDESVFSLNASLADVSVFQSPWSLFETLNLGFKPVNPVLITNAVNPRIFNRQGRVPFSEDRRIRLISTSWSDNPRKGGAIYKWLDDNLDWDRYEYTFVGRASEKLTNIRVMEPVPSKELAEILRQHDIYITASDNDPCSNALVEALACGLPAIYYNRGGHASLVGFGGLPFDRSEEIPELLERMVSNYAYFQDLISISDMNNIAAKYERCFGLNKQ
jgi:glycosyltransferase involved in cell wall biosynthesis